MCRRRWSSSCRSRRCRRRTSGVRCRCRRSRRCRRRRWFSAVQNVGQSVEESVGLSAAESVEVVGVDGPDDDSAEILLENESRFDLKTLLVVIAEPLAVLVAVGSDHFVVLIENFNY